MSTKFSRTNTPQPTPVVCHYREFPPLEYWQSLCGTLIYIPDPGNDPGQTITTQIYLAPVPEGPREWHGTAPRNGIPNGWVCSVYFYDDSLTTFSIGIQVNPYCVGTDTNAPPAQPTAGNGRALSGEIPVLFAGLIRYELYGLPLSPEV